MSPDDQDVVRWLSGASGALLFVTLASQVWRIHRDRVTNGGSRGFFLGQVSSFAGLAICAALAGHALFAFTNSMLLFGAIAGFVVVLNNRRRSGEALVTVIREACGIRSSSRPAPVQGPRTPSDLSRGRAARPPLAGRHGTRGA